MTGSTEENLPDQDLLLIWLNVPSAILRQYMITQDPIMNVSSVVIVFMRRISMYSPKVREDLVRKLYQLKHSTAERTPITKLVNKAVEEFLLKQENNNERNIEDNYRNNSRNNHKDIMYNL
jgi:hypothetical protein